MAQVDANQGEQDHFAFGLTPADAAEFREILRTECNEELTLEEAWTRATEVLAVFTVFLDRLSAGPVRRPSSSVVTLD